MNGARFLIITGWMMSLSLAQGTVPPSSPPPSVMFSAAEQEALQDALALTQNTTTMPIIQDASVVPERTAFLSLEAILYMSPSEWTVWINGQAYQAQETARPPHAEILAVFPDHITIAINGEKQDLYLHHSVIMAPLSDASVHAQCIDQSP